MCDQRKATDDVPVQGRTGSTDGDNYAAVSIGPSIEHFIDFRIERLLSELQTLHRLRDVLRRLPIPVEVSEMLREHINRT